MTSEQGVFLEELYRKYLNVLVAYARSSLENPIKAQDVVQDAFHQAALDVETLMTHINPGGWLMQTVKNKVKECKREERKYARYFLSLDSLDSFGIEPFDQEFLGEEIPPIDKIRQVLTDEEFHLLERIVFERASHLDMARELDISVWTSQKRWERIKKKLSKFFPGWPREK